MFNAVLGEGMGGLNVTDVRRRRAYKRIIQVLSLWSTVGETALAKGFRPNMGDTK